MKVKRPTRVTLDIKMNLATIKVYSGTEVIATLKQKRDGGGSYTRQTLPIEDELPEFFGGVDDFYITDLMGQLRQFKLGDHADLEAFND